MRKLLLVAATLSLLVGLFIFAVPQGPGPVTQAQAPEPPARGALGFSGEPGRPVSTDLLPPAAPSTEEGGPVPLGYELSAEAMAELKKKAAQDQAPAEGMAQDAALPAGSPAPSAPTQNSTWEALPFTGWIPPDPTLAAGPSDLVVAVNSSWAVYSKNGSQQYSNTLLNWFGNVLSADKTGIMVFDPWVLYDALSGRYVLLAVAFRQSDFLSRFLISVSDDSTALGGWCNSSTNARLDGSTLTYNWADYPKAGVTSNAVILSANMFSFFTGASQYAKVRVIAKSALYDTSCPGYSYYDFWDLRNWDFTKAFTVQPALSYVNSTDSYLINSRPGSGSSLTLWRLSTLNPLVPTLVRQATIGTAFYSLPPDAQQPGTSTLLNTMDARLFNAVNRGGKLWTAHAISCPGGSCLRWYQIDTASNALLQQGTFGASGFYYYYPAIVPDSSQNAVLVFNRSSASEYAGIRYTGRLSTDPVGTLQGSAQLRAGQGCYILLDQFGRNRWGDYNGIAWDPATGRTWVYSEFAYGTSPTCGNNRWRTQVGEVSWVPPPPAPSLLSPPNGSSTNDNTPTFDWTDVAGATYDLQVDNNADFSSPEINVTGLAASNYTPGAALADGLYNWRVRAVNAPGPWSAVWTFTVSTAPVTLAVVAPELVQPGSEFVARMNISQVTNIDAYRLDLSYDPAVIRVKGAEGGAEGVTPGLIDSTVFPVDMWAFVPPGQQGRIRVLGNLPGVVGKTGSGFLSEVHFLVVGTAGQSSPLTLSNVVLFNNQAVEITPVTLVDDFVQVAAGVNITTTSLPGGTVGVAYSQTLQATGGTPPYTWSVTAGSLPGGLTLDGATGVISGTPTVAGTFNFTVQVADSSTPPLTDTQALSILVVEPGANLPTAPCNLVAIRAVPGGRINLTWIDRSGNEDGFRVYRRTGEAGPFSLLAPVPANTEFYSDGSAGPGMHQYKVYAYNSAGEVEGIDACAP